MPAPTRLMGQQTLQVTQMPSPVGGLDTVSPYAAMDPTNCIALTNLIPSAYGAKTRLGSVAQAYHIGSTQATGLFTPPTSGTAAVVIGGLPVANCVFNTNATQTITDFKAVLAARSDISAIVTWTGTTTLTFTAKQPGALGNAITTTTSGGVGASWGAATLTGGVTANMEVRSVIPYSGAIGANDRLFVATSDGIYDCSTFNVAATKVVSWGSTGGVAGYCSFTSFTTAAGSFLALCDELNGYYTYTESTATWTKVTLGGGATQVSGVDPATFTSVCAFQNRLFFTVSQSGTGWYLGTGLIYGAATSFPFGNNMSRGGELRCYARWSVDGGAGVENNLCVLSSAGDISVYTGTDPSTVGKFTLVGTWSFSGLPAGRRLTLDSGGDVLILNNYGLISLSKLLQGASLADRSIYETAKIDNAITGEVTGNSSNRNWALQLSPDETSILISCPQVDGTTFVQYAMNMQTKGWARLEGRRAQSMGIYQSHLYFGTPDGYLFQASGGRDETVFSTTGTGISFLMFTSFQGLDSKSNNKRVSFVRPQFLTSNSDLNWITQLRWDYDLTSLTTAVTANPGTVAIWDTSTWDNAVWGGDPVRSSAVNGPSGMGRLVALIMKGIATTQSTLNSIDFTWQSGGLL